MFVGVGFIGGVLWYQIVFCDKESFFFLKLIGKYLLWVEYWEEINVCYMKVEEQVGYDCNFFENVGDGQCYFE